MNSEANPVSERPSPRVVLYCRPYCPEPATNGQEEPDCYSQEAVLRGRLPYLFGPPGEVRVINAGSDKKSRETALATLMEIVRTGECRLILMTDLARLGRGLEVYKFLELADKSKARVVAVDDGFDTAETDWRLLAMFAAMKQGFSRMEIE